MYTKHATAVKKAKKGSKRAAYIIASLGLLGTVSAAASVSSSEPVREAAQVITAPVEQEVPDETTESYSFTEESSIPFERLTEEDASLESGTSYVQTQGENGTVTRTYRVTLIDGEEVGREVVDEMVTKEPVHELTIVGTFIPPVTEPVRQEVAGVSRQASNCDPNYSGDCVPIASDVDCAGGSGNGPAYVEGPVTIIGDDVYRLDGDGDGIGCE